MRPLPLLGSLLALPVVAAACGGPATPTKQADAVPAATVSAAPSKPAAVTVGATNVVPRADFNRIAGELALPLFWGADSNKNGSLDADELAVIWSPFGTGGESPYKASCGFGPGFAGAYAKIVAEYKTPTAADDRRKKVRLELAQGRPTLVAPKLANETDADRRFVAEILAAAEIVEDLFHDQMGITNLPAPEDAESKMLFFRNHGPKCEAPKTENDPNCSALPAKVEEKLTGLYPKGLSGEKGFCTFLSNHADATKLMDPFTVVTGTHDAPKAVPYHKYYQSKSEQIAKHLDTAAKELDAGKEAALIAYLKAASKAFLDGSWFAADEAWAKMDTKNSRFYLRIGPDEVYAEPCSTKALFHTSFGYVDQSSIELQKKLDPWKQKMEAELASLAGAPYKERNVSFKLPDFVQIALNAGDARNPFGATIGQSLPNFGPVANEGRGRTVAMTGFYQDPDSLTAARSTAESLLCADAMALYVDSPAPQLMSTVLHEAAHNLGPAHQYKVGKLTDREVFGGPLASTLEELKAQTAALYFTDWLGSKKELSDEEVKRAHVRDLLWSFGHISRGMYEADKHPRNYSQLAAIQLGLLVEGKAVVWKASEMAANGSDVGCYSFDFTKYPATVKGMMSRVAKIKGKGDKHDAEVLIGRFVDGAEAAKVHEQIAERVLRAPKASFYYARPEGSCAK
jgi:hypothetical protein